MRGVLTNLTNYEGFMTYQVCTAKSQSMSKECKMFRIVAKVLVTGESGVSVAAVQHCWCRPGQSNIQLCS